MKKLLYLTGCLIMSFAALHGNAYANRMECRYSVDNLQVEAALKPGFERSYVVDISCTVNCTHCSGKETSKVYRYDIKPVVVAETGEEGKAEAVRQGRMDATRQAWKLLLEDCGVSHCDCVQKGCMCDACGRPIPEAASMEYRMETAPVPKNDVTIDKPVELKGISKPGDIEQAIREYVDKRFPGQLIGGFIKTVIDGRYIEMASVTDEKGQIWLVYFDMTDVYKKLERSKDKKTRACTQELIKKHLPLPQTDHSME